MVVDVANGDRPSVQLPRRYSLVIVGPPDEAHDAAAIVHCATQHVAPGGEIVTMVADTADAAAGHRAL